MYSKTTQMSELDSHPLNDNERFKAIKQRLGVKEPENLSIPSHYTGSMYNQNSLNNKLGFQNNVGGYPSAIFESVVHAPKENLSTLVPTNDNERFNAIKQRLGVKESKDLSIPSHYTGSMHNQNPLNNKPDFQNNVGGYPSAIFESVMHAPKENLSSFVPTNDNERFNAIKKRLGFKEPENLSNPPQIATIKFKENVGTIEDIWGIQQSASHPAANVFSNKRKNFKTLMQWAPHPVIAEFISTLKINNNKNGNKLTLIKWKENPIIEHWYSGEIVNIAPTGEPKDERVVSFIEVYNTLLFAVDNYNFELTKKLWERNKLLRDWFKGEKVNVAAPGKDEEEQRISFKQLDQFFEFIMRRSSRYLVGELLRINPLLMGWLTGEKVNIAATGEIENECVIPHSTLRIFFERALIGAQFISFSKTLWNSHNSLRAWYRGEPGQSEENRIISNEELINIFVLLLGAKQPDILDQLWHDNTRLKEAILGLQPEEYGAIDWKIGKLTKRPRCPDFLTEYKAWFDQKYRIDLQSKFPQYYINSKAIIVKDNNKRKNNEPVEKIVLQLNNEKNIYYSRDFTNYNPSYFQLLPTNNSEANIVKANNKRKLSDREDNLPSSKKRKNNEPVEKIGLESNSEKNRYYSGNDTNRATYSQSLLATNNSEVGDEMLQNEDDNNLFERVAEGNIFFEESLETDENPDPWSWF